MSKGSFQKIAQILQSAENLPEIVPEFFIPRHFVDLVPRLKSFRQPMAILQELGSLILWR
jgi:hypothetical protein